MELIYSTYRKQLGFEPPILESLNGGPTLCTISTGNIIAFTSVTELEDATCKSWGSHVYVCDMNTPWHSFKVMSSVNQISVLEWDIEGKYLLIADCVGTIDIYCCKEYLLNDWACLYTASLPGEHIIKAAFFHNGRKIFINTDKKTEQMPCTEKFQYQRFAPSVRQFGGVAAEGAIVITSTGLLGALVLPSEAPAGAPPYILQVAGESLGSTRSYIVTADICYGKSGHFLIAVSGGGAWQAVRCYRAAVRRGGAAAPTLGVASAVGLPPVVTSQPLPSFFLREGSACKDSVAGGGVGVVCVRWAAREDTDTLLVAGTAAGGRGSVLEAWGLVEKQLPVHSLLANGGAGPSGSGTPGSGTPGKQATDSFNTVMWLHQHQYRWPQAQIVSVVTLRTVQLGGGGVASPHASGIQHPVLPYVVVAFNDASVHLLYRDSLKPVCSTSVSVAASAACDAACVGVGSGGATPPKQIKYGSPVASSALVGGMDSSSGAGVVSCCDTSWLGGVLLAIDTHSHLYLYKLPQPATDTATPLSILHATTLLEYSLVTGYDALDIMMTLKTSAIEAVYDRLTELFVRQPSVWQQYHYVRWLCVRTALSRLTLNGQARASDLTSLLMLHSIAAAFKSLLRPSELTSHDKGPAESLAAVVSEHASSPSDMDAVLPLLEAKEFAAEPGALQSLRRLVQRVAETALHALAVLPARHAARARAVAPSYELWRDAGAVNTLRELLVVSRVWGLLRPPCLPAFSRAADCVDVLAALYRLLTRLAHSHCDPDEGLIEECIMLPSQVLVPRMWESLPRCCVATPQPHHLPLHLEYGVEPEILKYVPDLPPLEGSITTDIYMDSIRHTYLGGKPTAVKKCLRCGANTSPIALSRTPAARAWDQRWTSGCRCGGRWALFQYT